MSDFRLGLSLLSPHPVLGYGLGLALFAGALGLRLALAEWLPPGFPYLTFFPAVIITAFVAGSGPGILTAFLGGVAAWWFFIPPTHTLALHPGSALALAFYAVIVAVDIALIHVMNAALRRLDDERQRSARLGHQAQVMFSELQHRVSNNLQLISSLLQIQAAKTMDCDALKALEEAGSRIATLGRLHRLLHNPAEQAVDMGAFLRTLCRDVIDAAGAEQVEWTVTAQPVGIATDHLVPTALIVTELLSNALEHAFPDGRRGRIEVALHPLGEGGGFRLAVRDNGAGLPASFRLEDQTSLGLQIARSLAGQIGGRLSMERENGTVCTLQVSA
ncbi:MAG: sensor histidine kinase [Bacteroidales bacterium]